MKPKTERLRGSKSHGRGFRNKHKGGSRGGTGNAGLKTHKKFSKILALKAKEDQKKVTCFRDIESKLDRYLKKKYIIRKEGQLVFQPKFYAKYKKILSQGEPSEKYSLDYRCIKVSKTAKAKLE